MKKEPFVIRRAVTSFSAVPHLSCGLHSMVGRTNCVMLGNLLQPVNMAQANKTSRLPTLVHTRNRPVLQLRHYTTSMNSCANTEIDEHCISHF